jgi:hypothetical protein
MENSIVQMKSQATAAVFYKEFDKAIEVLILNTRHFADLSNFFVS